MLTYLKADITKLKPKDKPIVICHGANCYGVMGAGVALAIARKWPRIEESYRIMCRRNKNKSYIAGTSFVDLAERDIYIANCFSQIGFGGNPSSCYASPEWVEKSLTDAIVRMKTKLGNGNFEVYSVKMGCQRGGLYWDENSPEAKTSTCRIPIVSVFEKVSKRHAVDICIVDL